MTTQPFGPSITTLGHPTSLRWTADHSESSTKGLSTRVTITVVPTKSGGAISPPATPSRAHPSMASARLPGGHASTQSALCQRLAMQAECTGVTVGSCRRIGRIPAGQWGGAVREKGRRCGAFVEAPRAGLEPATLRLTAGCSTIELPRIAQRPVYPTSRRGPKPAQAPGLTSRCRWMTGPDSSTRGARTSSRSWDQPAAVSASISEAAWGRRGSAIRASPAGPKKAWEEGGERAAVARLVEQVGADHEVGRRAREQGGRGIAPVNRHRLEAGAGRGGVGAGEGERLRVPVGGEDRRRRRGRRRWRAGRRRSPARPPARPPASWRRGGRPARARSATARPSRAGARRARTRPRR